MPLPERAIRDLRRPAEFQGKKLSKQPAPRRSETAQLILSLELTSCSQKKQKGFALRQFSDRAARNRIQGLARQGRTEVSIALEATELFWLAGISRFQITSPLRFLPRLKARWHLQAPEISERVRRPGSLCQK